MTARILISFSLVLLLSGCGGLLARNVYEGLGPEEIEAIANSRLQVVRCFRVGGPPLGGSSMSIMYPHTAKGRVSFSPGSDCTVKEADIDLMGEEPEPTEPPKPFKIDPNEFNPKPRAVQPPPKLKSSSDPDVKILPVPRDFSLKPQNIRLTPSNPPKSWEIPKPDPCNSIGATGAKWVFCE